ncbi:MAG: tetratricopeptide repeat protein [Hydrocarboniphaga effusa]|nr:tetratricopeptide repeat protein [Hydrocarboniphaga effusa]
MPALDRLAAQTLQHTMQQTLQQTQTQTQSQTLGQAQTQTQEATAAHTGAPKVDFDVSGTYATDTVQINLDAGDPVSEAEFHRAYGLYDEAALLLKQALQKDPKRTDVRVKLAEIYFETNKAAEFVEIAKKLKGQLPDAEWQKIALLGSQVAAGNDLFKDATAGASVDLSFDEPAPAAAPSTGAARPPTAAPAADSGMLDFTMDDINKMPASEKPVAAAPSPAPVADSGLEFDMGSLALEPEKSAASKPAPAAGGDEFKMDDLNLGDFDLKHDTAAAPGTPPVPVAAPVAAATPEAPLELGGELSLEEAPAAGDESSTKLDLARAYMDMGDNDMARSLLNEVQKQGSAQQKKEAQELLSRVAA